MGLNLAKSIKRELLGIRRKLRRRYLICLKTGYVQQQMKSRRGVCGRHGCCDLTILGSLLHKSCLGGNDKSECLHWSSLPLECRLYPIDEKDKIPETLGYCNFYWE